jgi:hypothetical protein
MAINPMGTLPLELYEEQQALNRQQRMAQALMQQGQQMPQGQMVSGRFVPTSFFQNITPLVQSYIGSRMAEKADKQALDLAKQLRQRYGDELQQFRKIEQGTPAVEGGIYGADNKLTMQTTPDMFNENMELNPQYRQVAPVAGVAPNPQGAYDFAVSAANPALQQLGLKKLTEGPIKVGIEDTLIDPRTMKPVFTGAGKPRTPLQIDTGTAIELRDPANPTVVLQRIPKSQMPSAGQVVETASGPMIVNTRTGEAQPIMAGGQPLAPKLSSEQQKDITAINQQKATIDSALELVKATPSAFSFARGAAVALPFGESLAGRAEKPEETQARAAVFNIVSKVINERAGAAQSAQEIKRLNAFLPSEFDNATQIQNKLKGFNTFLSEQEKGTRVPASRVTPPTTPTVFGTEADAQKAIADGRLKKGDRVTINGVTGTIQ